MAIKILNKIQKEQLSRLLTYYNFFYICNRCGTVYGSDKKEVTKLCLNCEKEFRKENKRYNE